MSNLPLLPIECPRGYKRLNQVTKLDHSHTHPLVQKKEEEMHPLFAVLLLHITMATAAQLRPDFYRETCPQAEFIVRDVMKKALIREPRSVASVMRFQFHDCFVNVTVQS